MNKRNYPLQVFLKKHREWDVAYYGKPYDDQDKYELVITGVGQDIYHFIQDTAMTIQHPYIQFSTTLMTIHLNRLKQMQLDKVQDYVITLYHVGSRFGQERELTGWLQWMAEQNHRHPELKLELQFHHISQSQTFQISL